MRKAKKSMRVEVIALALFTLALVAYSTFFTLGSSVNAAGGDAAANAGCASSWNNFYQQAVQHKDPNPTQKADQQNSQVQCKAEGGSGHCNAKEGSQSPKDICGAEKDQKGEPLKMPEIPKKEPKKEEPKQPCDPNQQQQGGTSAYARTVFYGSNIATNTPCSNAGTDGSSFAPANFLSSIPQNIKEALTSVFGGESSIFGDDASEQLTVEQQLERITELVNQNPQISTEDKPAYIAAQKKYIEAAGIQVTTRGDVDKTVSRLSQQSVESIPYAPSEVQSDLRRAAIEQSVELVPTGEGTNTSTNIIATVGNWLKSLFGF